jgi:hypothetical protein
MHGLCLKLNRTRRLRIVNASTVGKKSSCIQVEMKGGKTNESTEPPFQRKLCKILTFLPRYICGTFFKMMIC